MVLLALTHVRLGVEVNGNTNWLALGPVPDPAVGVRQARADPVGRDVYARKEQLLDDWQQLLIPVVPGVAADRRRWCVGQRDLGTALVLFAILLGMLWVVGAPARLFVGRLPGRRRAGVLPRGHRARAASSG